MDHQTPWNTDVFHIKNKNAHSGMTYNEVKEYIAKTTGGKHTKKYSTTDVEKVKAEIGTKQERNH